MSLYESYVLSIEHILHNYPNHTFIFCGDYNLPNISWANDDSGLIYSHSTCIPIIPEFFAVNCFYQNNNIFNKHGSLLDLVFSNNNSIIVEESLDPLVPIDHYHPPLSISLKFNIQIPVFNHSHSFYDFKNADFINIQSFVNHFDWPSTFSSINVELAFNTFFDALHQSILRYVPLRDYTHSHFPPWFTKDLKEILILKKKAHAQFKSTANISDYRVFSLLRARFKYESKKCMRSYIHRSEASLINNPTNFWKFVNRHRSTNDIPKVLELNGRLSTDEQDAANLFSSYFSSVYTSEVIDLDPPNDISLNFDLPNNIIFSEDDVFRGLSALRNVQSIGPDGLPGEFLFQLRHIISYPLFLLFRRSLDEGIFPSILKFSSITPILKSGNATNVSNYRPISILSHLSKLFEKIVLNCIKRSVNNIVIDEQHGFRTGLQPPAT